VESVVGCARVSAPRVLYVGVVAPLEAMLIQDRREPSHGHLDLRIGAARFADHADPGHVTGVVGIDQSAMNARVLPAAYIEKVRGSVEIGDAAIEADRFALGLQLCEDIGQGLDADALPAQLLFEEQRVAVGHAVISSDIEETPR